MSSKESSDSSDSPPPPVLAKERATEVKRLVRRALDVWQIRARLVATGQHALDWPIVVLSLATISAWLGPMMCMRLGTLVSEDAVGLVVGSICGIAASLTIMMLVVCPVPRSYLNLLYGANAGDVPDRMVKLILDANEGEFIADSFLARWLLLHRDGHFKQDEEWLDQLVARAWKNETGSLVYSGMSK